MSRGLLKINEETVTPNFTIPVINGSETTTYINTTVYETVEPTYRWYVYSGTTEIYTSTSTDLSYSFTDYSTHYSIKLIAYYYKSHNEITKDIDLIVSKGTLQAKAHWPYSYQTDLWYDVASGMTSGYSSLYYLNDVDTTLRIKNGFDNITYKTTFNYSFIASDCECGTATNSSVTWVGTDEKTVPIPTGTLDSTRGFINYIDYQYINGDESGTTIRYDVKTPEWANYQWYTPGGPLYFKYGTSVATLQVDSSTILNIDSGQLVEYKTKLKCFGGCGCEEIFSETRFNIRSYIEVEITDYEGSLVHYNQITSGCGQPMSTFRITSAIGHPYYTLTTKLKNTKTGDTKTSTITLKID